MAPEPKPGAALAELEDQVPTKQVPPASRNPRSPMPPAESPPCLEAPTRLAEAAILDSQTSSTGAELSVAASVYPASQNLSQSHGAVELPHRPTHEELLARALRDAMDAPLDICEDEREEEEEEEERNEWLSGQENVGSQGQVASGSCAAPEHSWLRLPSKFGVLAEDRPYGPEPPTPSVGPSSCVANEAEAEAATCVEAQDVAAPRGAAPAPAEQAPANNFGIDPPKR